MKSQDLASRLQSIIETAIDGIILIDSKGIIEMINPAAATLFGYEPSEVVGENVSMLMPEPYRKWHDRYIENYLQTGEARIIGIGREVIGAKKDGTQFPFRLAISEVKSQSEQRVFTGIIHDLSAEKQAEEQLRMYAAELESRVQQRTEALREAVSELQASQSLYQAVAANFPHGILMVLNAEFRLILVDGKDLALLGKKPDELYGQAVQSLIPKENRELFNYYLLQVEQGQAVTFQMTLEQETYSFQAVPLHNYPGQEARTLVVAHNISRLKAAEAEVRKALAKERQLNELKSRFISMASHEFRTPLGTILSSASLMGRYETTDQQPKREKHITRIKSNVQNLTAILNDFLSISRLEEGKIALRIDTFDGAALCREIIDELRSGDRSIRQMHFELEGSNNMHTDKQMFRNILLNLLSNAIKYSDDDSTIWVNLANNSHRTELVVRDEGIGIPEEEQMHLFERFYRARNATNVQGTGLGLHIVGKYVHLMHGKVRFESKEGQGTTFFVSLPNLAQQADEVLKPEKE